MSPILQGGYSLPAYAQSLSEFGVPRLLPNSGGWILQRQIPESNASDGMGCYPLFTCRDWTALQGDCEQLAGELVSLTIVPDPMGDYCEKLLRQIFAEHAQPFKTHFVANLQQPARKFVSHHHHYYARKALDRVKVEPCLQPVAFAEEWRGLYQNLIRRHRLRGIKAFSERAFAEQLALPGAIVFKATHESQVVAAHFWLIDGDVGYSHLAAASERGYELMAAYALHWAAIEYFATRIRYLELGGGAGLVSNAGDGLARFKRGWANETRISYLCGAILDREKYRQLCAQKKVDHDAPYFPAYRANELA